MSNGYSKSGYLKDFNALYGTAGSALDSCVVCHPNYPSKFSLNNFGSDFAANGHNLQAIESFDSDGDGFTNLVEIQQLTFPGDPNSVPQMGGGMPGPGQGPQMMTAPTQHAFHRYNAVATPTVSTDPFSAMPIGLGTVSNGGPTLSTRIQLPSFDAPVDVYFMVYALSVDPFTIFYLAPDGASLVPTRTPWLSGSMGNIDHMPWGDLQASILPKGPYYLAVVVTQAGQTGGPSYTWVTDFTVN